MFRWIEPKKSNVSATSTNPPTHDRLNQFRYPNRKAVPDPTTPRRFDKVVLYVTFFLAMVSLLLIVGFHTVIP